MGLETGASYALVTSRYEFVDHDIMGHYRVLAVLEGYYYIYLKLSKITSIIKADTTGRTFGRIIEYKL